MGERSIRNWWRGRHALAYAHPWASTKREIWSGVVTGIAGGLWTAHVTNLHIFYCVLIGFAISVIGAFLPWTIIYVFALCTASGRDARERVSVLEGRLDRQGPVSPDFSPEWRERQRLLDTYTGSPEDLAAIDDWIQAIYDKLLAWEPPKALAFRPDNVPLTPEAEMAAERLARSGLRGSQILKDFSAQHEQDPGLKKLKVYGERLAAIQEGKRVKA